MSRRRIHLLAVAGALLPASCADRVETPAAPPVRAEQAEAAPAFRKKPRMNGRGEVTSIPLDKFFGLHQSGKVMVFDARLGFFHGLGHIPGAISLPLKNCDEAIHRREAEIKAALAAGKTIVVYCSGITCPDARSVARHLSGFGYPASVFSGGWDEWKSAGLPAE
jgi:3-mercaptopyruvate sulfurtransferase SseA